ncbi:MAG: addiction module protein [Acidimicrobiales bacterium]
MVRQAWAAELERRAARLDSGEDTAIPLDEARAGAFEPRQVTYTSVLDDLHWAAKPTLVLLVSPIRHFGAGWGSAAADVGMRLTLTSSYRRNILRIS